MKNFRFQKVNNVILTIFNRTLRSLHGELALRILMTLSVSFESLAREIRPHLVAEDKVSVRYRRVLFLLPSLAHTEVVKQIARDVGFEGNPHERREDVRNLFEVRISPRGVHELELR